jgi:hypothetical protein
MTKEQNDRLVLAFVDIAAALKGLHEEIARAGKRYWPEPGQQREPVLSRVETEEDRARKSLGLADESVDINKWISPDWLDELEDEPIGERTAQWLRDHPPEETKVVNAGAKIAGEARQGGKGIKEVKDKA